MSIVRGQHSCRHRAFVSRETEEPSVAQMPRHLIADISYRLERIDCSCGVVVTAGRDILEPDRHGPLSIAWENHRRPAVGRQPRRVA